MMKKDIGALRKEYTMQGLTEASVNKDPFLQFEAWFDEALESGHNEPNAMILSTVDAQNLPYQRTVLLKSYDASGFVFFTNYNSRKAQQIGQNPAVSLLFPWYGLERQIIINGTAKKVSTKDSLDYFLSRPRGSQLGAWVSHQSEVVSSRNILEQKLEEMKRKFKEGKVPLPDFWGGYRIIPQSFEFWQGRPSRLHDRIYYEQQEGDWHISRLSP